MPALSVPTTQLLEPSSDVDEVRGRNNQVDHRDGILGGETSVLGPGGSGAPKGEKNRHVLGPMPEGPKGSRTSAWVERSLPERLGYPDFPRTSDPGEESWDKE